MAVTSAPTLRRRLVAEFLGGASAGVLIVKFLYPTLTPAQAAQIVVPHGTDNGARPGADQRVASDGR